ncbi:UDP-glucosyltransferase 2-like [Toxorhynchites rutilus septentrionalis]|uniref:UDP-glucosyltransferase 2-like n=1 Tax=Toxorhynchites rutilus septentrionalis TaxID=329112 RepID=UPI002479989F|nr:UDP-glucosyltransferase 2-like [Toxorhynchites rutilus septentrionalis]
MNIKGLLCALVVMVALAGRESECARILAIFPAPAKSHQIVFRALVKGLLARGHHITMMTTDPFETNNPNITQINWNYAHKIVEENFDVAKMRQQNCNSLDIATQLLVVTKKFIEAELNHPEVQALIKNASDEHFDVLLVEYFQMTPFFAFAELFNIPMIGVTSIDSIAMAHEVVGNVMNVVAHPEMNLKFSSSPNFLQRMEAVINKIFIDHYLIPREFAKYDKIIEQNFGSNMTKSKELMHRIDFLMTNVEPVMGFVRPNVPRAIQLGFLHVEPPKALPADLQSYLDNSQRGVIYFSLGTLIRSDSINLKNLNIFVETFKSLKYDILWKCDSEVDLNGTSNIRVARWLPQQDLLAHPNVKLFVMQGGQQSMEEAVDRQVPMVVIPFNFDQFANADRIVERGIGKSIWMERLTVRDLRDAIVEVIGNKKYKRNIERLSQLVKDQPMQPIEKAVWWTEYIIRHQGAAHYRYHAAQMPVWQYHYYDVAVTFLIAALVGAYVTLHAVRRFFNYLFDYPSVEQGKKQKIL